jgi:hypothetical protein
VDLEVKVGLKLTWRSVTGKSDQAASLNGLAFGER